MFCTIRNRGNQSSQRWFKTLQFLKQTNRQAKNKQTKLYFFSNALSQAQKISYTPNQARRLFSGHGHYILKQYNSDILLPFTLSVISDQTEREGSLKHTEIQAERQWVALGGGVAHSKIKIKKQVQDQAKIHLRPVYIYHNKGLSS